MSLGSQTANSAPAGSVYWASRPSVKTSIGGTRTVPPACSTVLVLRSASGVWKYTVHAGFWPSAISGPTAATVLPFSWKNP